MSARRSLLSGLLLLLWMLSACTAPVRQSAAVRTQTAMATPSPRAQVTPTRTQRVTAPAPTLTPTPTSAVQVSASSLSGQIIEFWHPFTGQQDLLVQELVADFNAHNAWGVQVKPVSQGSWGNLEETFVSSAAAGRPALLAGQVDLALRLDENSSIFVDLTTYASDAQWGLSLETIDDIYPAMWAQDYVPDGPVDGAGRAVGKRLGLPWYRSGAYLVYNVTWARELGYKNPPASPQDFYNQACAAAQANRRDADSKNDATGGWLVVPEPAVFSSWLFAFGGEIARPDRTGYQLDTPEVNEALAFLHQLNSSACAWQSTAPTPYRAFANRQALFWVDSSGAISTTLQAMQQAGNVDEWALLPFFSAQGQPKLEVAGPALLVTRSQPSSQLAAWLFARWLLQPQSQARWAAGAGVLPVSKAAVEQLQSGAVPSAAKMPLPVQYLQALRMLPYAHSQPAYASWGMVRWALEDALAQALTPALPASQLPEILKTLDALAAEIHAQYR